jgi:hypothetical protein
MDFGLYAFMILMVVVYIIIKIKEWIEDLSYQNWKKKKAKLPEPININIKKVQMAVYAVVAAREKFGFNLDLSKNSMPQLEKLLSQAHDQYRQSASTLSSTNIPIEHTMTTWGAFLGEAIRRRMGGNWILDHNQPFIQLGSRRLDPVGQVRLRITEGPQYNVENYFWELKPEIFKPNYSPGYSRAIHSGPDNIQDYGINELRSSGKFTPAEYRRRGKSPSGVIDGEYNDAYRGNDEYNDSNRDWDANA